MMSLNRVGAPLLALGLGLTSLLGGCVGQGEYDRLYETNASLTSRNKELTAQLDEQRQSNDLMRNSMGKGEGTPELWVCRVKPGRIMFEIDGVPVEVAREALALAAAKLSVKTRFVERIAE